MTKMLIRKTLRCAGLALSIVSCFGADVNPALWSGLKYRMIGPERGGRVTAVTGVASQPFTFYMGSTGGGVWKTVDAGHNWVNLSDGQIPLGSSGGDRVAEHLAAVLHGAVRCLNCAAIFDAPKHG